MKFYFLNENFDKRGYIRLAMNIDITLKELRAIKFEEKSINKEIIYKISSGKKKSDILWTTGAYFYFSNKTINLLKSNMITGWNTFPISIDDKNNKLNDSYYGLITEKTKLVGMFKKDSQIKKQLPNGREWIYQKGVFFDIDRWNGNDIFALKNEIILFSERVVDVLSKIECPNSVFTETSEKLISLLVLKHTKNITWI